MTTTTLVRLRHDEIHPDPDNLRQDVGDLTDLPASIAGVGLLQPMIVRQVDDKYILIAGVRRHTAIGRNIVDGVTDALDKFDCIKRAKVDDATSTASMIVENLHRSGLTPAEEYSGLMRLSAEHGWTTEQIATQTGIPLSTVKSRLSWAKLPPHCIASLMEGRWSVDAANMLSA